MSNQFYLDMGFGDMQMSYNTSCGLENTEENMMCTKNNPMIEKPDWNVICHASAWDDTFGYTKEDFRYILIYLSVNHVDSNIIDILI